MARLADSVVVPDIAARSCREIGVSSSRPPSLSTPSFSPSFSRADAIRASTGMALNWEIVPWASFAAPDGLLGTGVTGLERLIDPDTMEYVFISPVGWPQWSRDFRYVSVGQVGGHGGICGP